MVRSQSSGEIAWLPTAQDVLRDQRHERCVMKILLQRIAPPDPLDDQTGRLPDHFSIPGLAAAEGTSVAKREVLA
jgi:hypothetical protein